MSAPSPTPFTDPGFASGSFMIISSALVCLMTPGVGLLYAGLARSKNALSLIMMSFLAMAVVTIQWVLFGFTLAFSETGSPSIFMGNFMAGGGMKDIGLAPLAVAPAIPGVLFCLYQLQFATVTASIIFGSVAERLRLLPAMIFVFLWTTIVYDPVAYWTWAYRGWLRNISCISAAANGEPCGVGSYDYAGGGPVHIASGFAGLAYCLVIGRRKGYGREEFKPHNLTQVFLGTALLWFGWFGFNGGSALAATPRAAMAALVTTVSAAAGALTWTFVDYARTGKFSAVSFCSGAIAGLVTITPSSGFVAPWAAIVIGIIGGFAVSYAIRIKEALGFDDSLDAWGLHAVGGFLGNILTGIFAQKWVATLDNTVIEGGWLDGNFKQIGYQLAGNVAIAGWSFVVSFIILFVMNKIPGLSLRSSEEDEMVGNDMGEMGEVAYELIPKSSLPHMESVSTLSKENLVS